MLGWHFMHLSSFLSTLYTPGGWDQEQKSLIMLRVGWAHGKFPKSEFCFNKLLSTFDQLINDHEILMGCEKGS